MHIGKLLAGQAQWVKVGMTLYYAYGPSIVSEMHDMGFKVFLDLKLHDIPHQIRGAAKAASRGRRRHAYPSCFRWQRDDRSGT